MRKRILSLLMAVAMVVSMLPTVAVPAFAADDHSGHTGWTELTAGGELTGGKYYLSGALTQDITIAGDVTLCLNGNTLTGNISISSDAALTICDCTATYDSTTYEHGPQLSGGVIVGTVAVNGGTLTLESGKINGYVGFNGALYIKGGEISNIAGSYAIAKQSSYGAPAPTAFEMTGGYVSSNYTYGEYLNSCTINFIDLNFSPTFSGGTVVNTSSGYAVYATNANVIYNGGYFHSASGSALCSATGAEFNLKGGTFATGASDKPVVIFGYKSGRIGGNVTFIGGSAGIEQWTTTYVDAAISNGITFKYDDEIDLSDGKERTAFQGSDTYTLTQEDANKVTYVGTQPDSATGWATALNDKNQIILHEHFFSSNFYTYTETTHQQTCYLTGCTVVTGDAVAHDNFIYTPTGAISTKTNLVKLCGTCMSESDGTDIAAATSYGWVTTVTPGKMSWTINEYNEYNENEDFLKQVVTLTPANGFTVTIANEEGNPIQPTSAGNYRAMIGSTGAYVPFTITPLYTYTVSGTLPTGITITPNEGTANVGDTITLTVAGVPDGYKLVLTVKDDSNNTVTVTPAEGGDGDYTFKMPASNVTVSASSSISFKEVDASQRLYQDETTGKYYQLGDDGEFDEVHVHTAEVEGTTTYTVYQLWDGTSVIANGKYALKADVVNATTDVNAYHSNVEICLNGHKYTAENNKYTTYVRGTVTIGDCIGTGSMLNLWCDIASQGNTNVTLNGITANAVAVIGATLTVNGGTYTYILPTSGVVNLNGNIEITGSTESAGLRTSDSATINLGSDFAGTGKITVDESNNNDSLTFGETWTFITSGAGTDDVNRFAYFDAEEVLKDGVTTEIQTVLEDGTLSFKAVHKHSDGTEYVGWDGSDIETAGNYVMTKNIPFGEGSDTRWIEAEGVNLCLNGYNCGPILRIADGANATISDCSADKTGNIEFLRVRGTVTLEKVNVYEMEAGGTVHVSGGELGVIYVLSMGDVTLDGAPVINGTTTTPGIQFPNTTTPIKLGENFAGTGGTNGEKITVGLFNADIKFGTPWTFVTSGATEGDEDLFVYHKTAEELDDDVTTEIQTILDENAGSLTFKAVHVHDKGTNKEIVFDKALDLSIAEGEIENSGNYVVTAKNPYNDDAQLAATVVGMSVEANICLNGMDCGNSMIAAHWDTDLTVYDHKDENGVFQGRLYEVRTFGNGAVINGGNFEVIGGASASITFNDGTVAGCLRIAAAKGDDLTLDVKGGVIGAITARASEDGGSVKVNLSGSPVITGDGSDFFQSEGERLDTEGHIVINPGTLLNIADNFEGSADEDGEKITVQFWNKSAPLQYEISVGEDIAFAQGKDLSDLVDTFAYYDSSRNVSVEAIEGGAKLSFHLDTIKVDNVDKEAIDDDNDGIYEDEDGYEVYIPTGKDNNNLTYTEVEKNEDDYTEDETTGVYNDKDGVFEDEEGNRYIPVDTDGDNKADDSLVDKAPADGIFEDDDENTYVPDQNGDGKPEKVTDTDGDGIYEGEDLNDDDKPDQYIPDSDGDGKAETDPDRNGIFDGSDEDQDKEFVPDEDGDKKGEEVADDNNDGVYETTDPENDDKYIPDQDGDGKPEKEKEDEPGIFEGSDEEKDKDYVVDPDKGPPYVEVEKDEDSGVYEPVDTEDEDKYIPDQDGDGYAEKDDDDDGIFEGTKDETEYIPDVDGDGEAETDDDDDGIFEGSEDGENYIPDQDGDNIPEKEKEDEPGIFEGSDEEKDKDYVVDPDKDPPYVEAEKDEESGVYEPVDDEDEDKYIPDQDGDGYAEKDDDDDGVFEGTDDDLNKDYISNGNGGFVEYIPYYPPVKPPVHDCPSKVFSDVNTELWYHEAIDFVLLNGYMNGMGNGLFQPNSKLNRAMIVQVLYNMENRPEVEGGSGFTDVADTAWYADAIAWAASNGIVNGYGDTFGPNDPITREQMAAILYRYAAYKGIDVTERGDLSIFKDGDKTSSWASDAMRWAIKVGLMSGKGDGILDPTGTATRAEVAQTLMNYCTKILNK